MKLLFDLKAAQGNVSGKRHGGGKYAEIVLKKIVERGLQVSCFYDSTMWLNPEMEAIVKENGINLFDIKGRSIDSLMEEYHFDRVYSALPINVYDVQKGEVYGDSARYVVRRASYFKASIKNMDYNIIINKK